MRIRECCFSCLNINARPFDIVAASMVKFQGSDQHTGIRVFDEMSVKIMDATGGDHFSINTIIGERQAILQGEVTNWWFTVTPKQKGSFPLLLRITIHSGNRSKDLDILEKEIIVQSGVTAAAQAGEIALRRILFQAANPYDTSRLRLGAETRGIQQELAMATNRQVVFTMNMAVTTRTLMRSIIKEKPDIVHFSWHGENEGLCLETPEGATKMVDEITLAALFSQFDATVDCVVLNACYSESQARAIARQLPYVFGMARSIPDKAALAFSIGFYMALAEGTFINKAFFLGLINMQMETPGQQKIPVLIEKSALVEP